MSCVRPAHLFLASTAALATIVAACWDVRTLLFLPLVMSIGTVEAVRRKKLGKYDFLTGINFVFALGYAIAPLLVLTAGDEVFFEGLRGAVDRSDDCVIAVAALSTLGYWALVLGYAAGGNPRPEVNSPQHGQQPQLAMGLTVAGVFAFFVGSAAFVLYATMYGGLIDLLTSAAAIREGEVDVPSRWVFLVHVTPLVLPATWWLLWRWKLALKAGPRLCWLVAFYAALLFAVVTQAATAGRSIILVVIMSAAMAPFVRTGRLPSLKLAAALGTIVFAFIIVGKQFFGSLSWGTELEGPQTLAQDALFAFFREFTHLYLGIQNAVQAVPSRLDMRGATDFFVGLQWLLPGELFGIRKAPSIAFWNTEISTGVFKSVMPPGLIGYGYYALLFPGIIIIPFLYGLISGVVENRLIRFWHLDARVSCFYIVCGFAFAYGTMNSDPRVFFVSNFWVLLLAVGGSLSLAIARRLRAVQPCVSRPRGRLPVAEERAV